jgi:hypothetical protein
MTKYAVRYEMEFEVEAPSREDAVKAAETFLLDTDTKAGVLERFENYAAISDSKFDATIVASYNPEDEDPNDDEVYFVLLKKGGENVDK